MYENKLSERLGKWNTLCNISTSHHIGYLFLLFYIQSLNKNDPSVWGVYVAAFAHRFNERSVSASRAAIIDIRMVAATCSTVCIYPLTIGRKTTLGAITVNSTDEVSPFQQKVKYEKTSFLEHALDPILNHRSPSMVGLSYVLQFFNLWLLL